MLIEPMIVSAMYFEVDTDWASACSVIMSFAHFGR